MGESKGVRKAKTNAWRLMCLKIGMIQGKVKCQSRKESRSSKTDFPEK